MNQAHRMDRLIGPMPIVVRGQRLRGSKIGSRIGLS